MKIGIFGINIGGESVARKMLPLAQKAEEVGVESVWTGEHVIVPVDYASRYPYSSDGKLPASPETNFVDPLIALTHIAAQTEHLRLGTGINILPQSNPLLLAKQAASLDALSGGRLMLGLGVGWLEEEFQALGAPFSRRGARTDDYLAAMKKVWSGEVVEHRSEFLSWSGFKSHPLPVQKPHPPLIIGGHSPAALRRAVTLGDGWFGFTQSLEEFTKIHQLLDQIAQAAGRDLAGLEITALWNMAREGKESLEKYKELGVSRLLVPLWQLGEKDLFAGLDKLGNQVISRQ